MARQEAEAKEPADKEVVGAEVGGQLLPNNLTKKNQSKKSHHLGAVDSTKGMGRKLSTACSHSSVPGSSI